MAGETIEAAAEKFLPDTSQFERYLERYYEDIHAFTTAYLDPAQQSSLTADWVTRRTDLNRLVAGEDIRFGQEIILGRETREWAPDILTRLDAYASQIGEITGQTIARRDAGGRRPDVPAWNDALALEAATGRLLELAGQTPGYGVPISAPQVVRINGTPYDDTITGNDLGNQLVAIYDDVLIAGGDGSMLRGHVGDDRLEGGLGRDTFVFDLGDGRDTIVSDGDGGDTLSFGDGIDHDQILFSRLADDLVIDVIGADDRVTVDGWFGADGRAGLAAIETGDDYLLLQKDVARLVELMAGFDAPAAGATRLTDPQRQQIAVYFAGPSGGA